MTRLKTTFDNLKQKGEKAFSVFLMSGYPDKETFIELMHLCSNEGVDFLEIGMPFSDPSADGPVIKTAGTVALKNKTTVKETIESVREFRKTNNTTPIVWMGYFNAIYNYGIEKFLDEIETAGVDGILFVDLPAHEFERVKYIENKDVDIIRLVTPGTTKERLPELLKTAGGFIYFISVNGVTGTKEAQSTIRNNVEYIKTQTELPVMVGFGIRTAEKAKEINKFADGSIVGTAVINKISEYLDKEGNVTDKEKMFNTVKDFVKTFKS